MNYEEDLKNEIERLENHVKELKKDLDESESKLSHYREAHKHLLAAQGLFVDNVSINDKVETGIVASSTMADGNKEDIDIVLQYIQQAKRVKRKELKQALFDVKSLDHWVGVLVQQGKIDKVDRGTYAIVE